MFFPYYSDFLQIVFYIIFLNGAVYMLFMSAPQCDENQKKSMRKTCVAVRHGAIFSGISEWIYARDKFENKRLTSSAVRGKVPNI